MLDDCSWPMLELSATMCSGADVVNGSDPPEVTGMSAAGSCTAGLKVASIISCFVECCEDIWRSGLSFCELSSFVSLASSGQQHESSSRSERLRLALASHVQRPANVVSSLPLTP